MGKCLVFQKEPLVPPSLLLFLLIAKFMRFFLPKRRRHPGLWWGAVGFLARSARFAETGAPSSPGPSASASPRQNKARPLRLSGL